MSRLVVVSGAADLRKTTENLAAARVFTKPVRFQSLLAELQRLLT